jgi:hypothetical protein
MINGKPVTVQPDYKWGKAPALGVGDDDDVYLVTTGLGDEMNQKVAEQTALALNCHAEMLQALKDLLFNAVHGNGLEAHWKARDRATAIIAKAEGRV